MPRSHWTHSETVCLIDCLHEAKRLDDWTLEERRDVAEQVQRKLEASGSPDKSMNDIYHRIVHVGKKWTTKDKSNHLALYFYGWQALRYECSRSVLLSDPTGKFIPKANLQPPTASSNLRRSRSPKERYVKLTDSVGEFTLRGHKAASDRVSGSGYDFLLPVQVSCTMRSYSIGACLTTSSAKALLFNYQWNGTVTLSVPIFIGSLWKSESSKISGIQHTNRRY